MSLYRELKRRNVIRVAIAYLAGSWLLVEVAETIFPLFGYGDTPARIMVIVLAIGFPLFLLFSWVFEITPEGLKKEKDIDRTASVTHKTGKQLDRIIIVLLALALGYFAFDKFVLEPARVSDLMEETAQQARSEALVESYGDQSIAVLPFVNMSADPEQEYFSDGISEELLNLLAKIPELRVISRSSAFVFKGEKISIPEVAKKLNVAHILEGSVRKAGDRVRITAQLIEARSDTHLWSESYDRELDDIFAVQDEIAAAISAALKMKLALVAGEAVHPTVIKAANTVAYDAYLQGRELIRRRGQLNLQNAIVHLERSLRLDESFAPAHAQLAIAMILYTGYTPGEKRRKALPHLDRAQELEPDLAEAHGGRALLANLNSDSESSIEHARKALAVNPNYIDAMNWLGIALDQLGRYEEADSTLRQMLLIDPLTIIGRVNYAETLGWQGQLEQAHDLADQVLAQSPELSYYAHAMVSMFCEGKIAEGLSWSLRELAENPSKNSPTPFQGLTWVGEYNEARRLNEGAARWADLAEGHFDQAIQAATRRLQANPDDEFAVWGAANIIYTAGHIDEALPLYEKLDSYGVEERPILSLLGSYRSSNELTMQLALARRTAGDEEGAQAAVHIVKKDHAALGASGRNNQYQHRTEAMLAAFEHDPQGVLDALQSAIGMGLRDPQVFDDAIFEGLRNEPRFMALQRQLDVILDSEHDKVLQLICFNNPVPDEWQPMPETCDGVDKLQD